MAKLQYRRRNPKWGIPCHFDIRKFIRSLCLHRKRLTANRSECWTKRQRDRFVERNRAVRVQIRHIERNHFLDYMGLYLNLMNSFTNKAHEYRVRDRRK